MAIRVTPEQLDAMANQLKNLAMQASSLANAVNTAITTGTGAWEGSAQKDFVDKFNEIKPTLEQKLPELLTEMASSASSRAEAYRQADKA